MPFLTPKQDAYIWTNHAHQKMRHYHLTESRVKRIIRYPTRYEEGILENGIACMQSAGGKHYSEIWVMYLLSGSKDARKIKVITCWRYPGKSPLRDPVPADVIREIQMLI